MNIQQKQTSGDHVKAIRRRAFDIQSLIGKLDDNVSIERGNKQGYIAEGKRDGFHGSLQQDSFQDVVHSSHECYRHRIESSPHLLADKEPHFEQTTRPFKAGIMISPYHDIQPEECSPDSRFSRGNFHDIRERFLPVFNSLVDSASAANTAIPRTCRHFFGTYLGSRQMNRYYGEISLHLLHQRIF